MFSKWTNLRRALVVHILNRYKYLSIKISFIIINLVRMFQVGKILFRTLYLMLRQWEAMGI